MPSNIRNVSFTDPQNLIAPDLAVQQQQNARQQAIVDALRQQAMEGDIRVAPGSHSSWTQGAAKVMAALVAKGQQKKIDEKSLAMAQQYSQALRGMFGGQGPAPTARIAQTGASLAPPATQSPDNMPMAPQGGAQPAPQAPGAQAPIMAQQAPEQAPQRGPWSLSGNPQNDMADYMLNSEEYGKAVIASHAPDDFAKHLIQSGVDPNSPEFRQAMQAKTAKDNYVAPVNGRPGSTIRDPMDPSKVIGYDAPNIEGAVPVYGPDGMPTGYKQLPGANEAMQGVSAAKAVGGAAGELVDVYNPATHQMVKIPKSALLSGAANGQTPMASAPPLGADKAFDVTGTNSANAFQAISDGAADAPNRIYALNQMSAIVADPKTVLGPGSEQWNKVRGVLGTLTGTSAPSTTNAQEFSKWASQYSARSAQELGLSGSDARVQIAVHATPNGEMTKDALRSVIPQMVGIEHAKQGFAVAADRWQQAHGPDSVQTFRTEWNKVYNPSIYTHMVQGQQAFAGWVKSLNPQQAAQVRQQYIQLKQFGALPQ